MQFFARNSDRRPAQCVLVGFLSALAVFAGTVLPAGAAKLHPLAISAGGGHTCALTGTGAVECWGSNFYGQLGAGAIGDQHTPVAVPGLTGVLAISAGGEHTCIVNKDHGVMCWGDNSSGQLGDNNAEAKAYFPVAVSGLASGVAAVAAGGSHTCALTQTGAVKCWGSNASGQLGNGDGTGAQHPVPVDVRGLSSGVSGIGSGQAGSCALTVGETVKCWGWNGSGQLGNGVKGGQSPTPVHVKAAGGAIGLAVGSDHNCALTEGGGTVKCWGENVVGELGDGNTNPQATAVRVHGFHNPVAAISAGSSHSCAIIQGGEARCWGNNVYGMIGNGTHNVATSAVRVKKLGTATFITAGSAHSCALLANGHAKCWGSDEFGQLGNGFTNDSSTPVNVTGF